MIERIMATQQLQQQQNPNPKKLIDKLSHHRDYVNTDRDNPERYFNISTDVTFTDGTTQEISILNSIKCSKIFHVSKKICRTSSKY